MTTAKPKSKPKQSPTDIKIERKPISSNDNKIDQLINELNKQSNTDMNFHFWKNKDNLGDIVGTVPVTRTVKLTIPGHFNPYDRVEDQTFLQLYVIDVADNNMFSQKDADKKNALEKNGYFYIKHSNIKSIFSIIMNNL